MPISSCRTFHIKNLSSHALTCCFTALVSTRSSLCDPKWLFCVCVFFMPPPSNSRDLLSPCMSICSLCASHTLMILFHVFSCRLSTLVFSRHPICGLKWLFCVFNLTSPSTFRDPLSPCMSICSLTRLTLSSSDVMRFSCPATRLCVAIGSRCKMAVRRVFAAITNRSRGSPHPVMCLCSPDGSHTLII